MLRFVSCKYLYVLASFMILEQSVSVVPFANSVCGSAVCINGSLFRPIPSVAPFLNIPSVGPFFAHSVCCPMFAHHVCGFISSHPVCGPLYEHSVCFCDPFSTASPNHPATFLWIPDHRTLLEYSGGLMYRNSQTVRILYPGIVYQLTPSIFKGFIDVYTRPSCLSTLVGARCRHR